MVTVPMALSLEVHKADPDPVVVERTPPKFRCHGEVVEVVGDKKNNNSNLKSSFKPNFMNKKGEYR